MLAIVSRHNTALRYPDAAEIAVMRRLVESFPDDLEARTRQRCWQSLAASGVGMSCIKNAVSVSGPLR
jgi:hypothetical protein